MINLNTLTELHLPVAVAVAKRIPAGTRVVKQASLKGLGADIDFTSIINRGIDVVGSALAKQPSGYVSPNDPRYRAQPPQNVYMVQPAPAVNTPAVMPEKKSGLGFQIDQKTLILAAGALLIFMVASKR
jgi:hypothetical protein